MSLSPHKVIWTQAPSNSCANFKATNFKAQPRAVPLLFAERFFSSTFPEVLKEAEILYFFTFFRPTLSLRRWKTLCLKHTEASQPLGSQYLPILPLWSECVNPCRDKGAFQPAAVHASAPR